MNICSFEEELFMIVVVVRGGGKGGEKVEGILSFSESPASQKV